MRLGWRLEVVPAVVPAVVRVGPLRIRIEAVLALFASVWLPLTALLLVQRPSP